MGVISGIVGRADALRHTLGHASVAPYVAVLAAGDHKRCVGVAYVAHRADGMRVDAADRARADHVLRAIAELEFDLSLVNEVGLFLLVVEVRRSPVARREDDRVYAKGCDAQLLAYLPEARLIAEGVQRAESPSISGHD